MTSRRSFFLALFSILLYAGCDIQSTTTINSGNDSITNQGGVGTGSVAGVKLKVMGLVANTAGLQHSQSTTQVSGAAENPTGESETERWDVKLGNLSITLVRNDQPPLLLSIDGSGYGTVQSGDELVIDEEGNVTINGETRTKD